MEQANLTKLYKAVIYVGIFCIYYILFLNQGLLRPGPLGSFAADTSLHVMRDSASVISSNHYLHDNWLTLVALDFEPFLHIMTAFFAILIHLISQNTEQMDLSNAMALILSLAKLSEFIIIKRILDNSVKLNDAQSLFITAIINFCTVLYLPIINLNVYFPMLSPNILHNPTSILLTPIAITFFYWYLKLYISSDAVTYKHSILFSLLLVIATLVKPSFTNVMLIMIALYYLFHLKRFTSNYFRHDLLIFVPAALVSFYQIHLISILNYGTLTFAPYKVIGHFTEHPILNLLQAIGFPLLIAIVSAIISTNIISIYLRFSWLYAFIAYLIWSLFYLSGPTWDHANLAWSYSLSLTFLYIFSIITFVRILADGNVREDRFSGNIARFIRNKDRAYNLIVNICAINLGFVFLSGLNQFVKVYFGGSWL